MRDNRLGLNQKTTNNLSLEAVVELCVTHGFEWVGLWREPVAEYGLEESAALVRNAGLKVSSLCRGGFFPSETPADFEAAIVNNQQAVDEAVALSTDVVVLVCGGIAGGDLDRSREQVAEGIGRVAPYAQERGVKLAIEPLHPMFAADRSVIVTMKQALDIAEQHPKEAVGVVVDTFHSFWDPDVYVDIARAADRIVSFQICDWPIPLPDILLGRTLPGDGVIDIPAFDRAVTAAGYTGPIEVEVFNRAVWALPGDEVAERMKEFYSTLS